MLKFEKGDEVTYKICVNNLVEMRKGTILTVGTYCSYVRLEPEQGAEVGEVKTLPNGWLKKLTLKSMVKKAEFINNSLSDWLEN